MKRYEVLGGILTVIFTMIVSGSVLCGAGPQLREFSAGSQGTSWAGATAKGGRPSAIFFNPAGLSLIEGHSAEINFSYIIPGADFDLKSVGAGGVAPPLSSDQQTGNVGPSCLVPASSFVFQLSERWHLA